MSKTSLQLPYLSLAGAIVIAVAATFAVLRPWWGEVMTVKAQAVSLQQQAEEQRQFLATIDRKKGELASQAVTEKQLSVMLPVDLALEDVTRQLQRASQAAGIVILRLNNQSAAEQGSVKIQQEKTGAGTVPVHLVPLAFVVEAQGTYQQLRVFHEQLEKSPRLLDVQSLEYQRSDLQPDQITARIRVRFYAQEATDTTL